MQNDTNEITLSPSIHHKNKYLISFFALLVIPLSGLCIDIYVPSLPALSHYFNIENALAQLTITAYVIGLGIMQLFAGGISDSFGRKKPYMIGMCIFILATLLIPWSNSIYQLIALRFLQGISIAVAIVPMRSVVLDLFEGRELHKMTNYMTMAWSIGPIIAPAIGGYLQEYFGWQACFYFLAIYSIIVYLLTIIYMPETSRYYHPFHTSHMIKRYGRFLLNWKYSTGVITDGLLYSIIIIFSVLGPFLIQTTLGYSAIQFGYIAFLMGLVWFLGVTTNRFLIDIPLKTKAKRCFWAMLIISLITLVLTIFFPLNIYNIVIPIFCLLWLGGIVFPSYFTRSVSLFPETGGSANALFGSILFCMVGVSSWISTFLKSTSGSPLAIAYLIIMIFCLVIYYFDFSKIKNVNF